MSSFKEVFSHPSVDKIIELHTAAAIRKEQAAYNLFTLSSYNNQRENFHSDVLGSLLNPNDLHKEGPTFVNLFLAYINTHHHLGIDPNSFTHVEIYRESGRLDLWIHDTESKQNIIIENKMNNAPDMDDQLSRYYHYINNGYGSVQVIIYLTLEGFKNAPPLPAEITCDVRNIGAFADMEADLVSGWLIPCRDSCTNEDSRSLIHQYIKLIKQLAHQSMNSNTQKEFYEYFGDAAKFETAKTLVDLLKNLPTYRRNLFHKEIIDFGPFRNAYLYPSTGNRASLFENYNSDGFTFKLDVWFNDDGSARVWFWIPSHRGQNNKIGYEALTKKLSAIDMLHKFQVDDYTYIKDFTLKDHKKIQEVDRQVVAFVRSFLEALRSSEKSTQRWEA